MNMLQTLQMKDVSEIQLKSKVQNMKASYIKAVMWRYHTGQGVDDGNVEVEELRETHVTDETDKTLDHEQNSNAMEHHSSQSFNHDERAESNNRPANSAEVIAQAQKLRAEAIKEKLQQESFWRNEELILSREKFELEKELRLKEMELSKAEIESIKRIKMAEINANIR
ncbi:hypothetical protein Bhyg_00661 [Pseudolycoriella hygida]|uniref:Uncharacterized protein n=1 Tax=Pseudolycoriella hygida TaxID=35572 RepID=A0A9Q0S6M7_9DIPT|nr:hypothetical protein Bhyg_00661 [Pseudolycoriella hygida]